MLNDILGISFFIAAFAAVLKAIRHVVEYKRHHQRFYLIGVPANLAFAIALALIIVGSGPDPVWRNDVTVTLFRWLIIVWAVLGLLFEFLYSRTYIIVKPNDEIYRDVDTHGD